MDKGDVIWVNRIVKGLPYNHCGIYEGDGKVIHFAPLEGMEISQKNGIIHRTTIEKFKDNCPLFIMKFPQKKCFPPDVVVKRARSRLGEKGYDLKWNNCDHFATWCKTGKHKSIQVDIVKGVGKIIITRFPIISIFVNIVFKVQEHFEEINNPEYNIELNEFIAKIYTVSSVRKNLDFLSNGDHLLFNIGSYDVKCLITKTWKDEKDKSGKIYHNSQGAIYTKLDKSIIVKESNIYDTEIKIFGKSNWVFGLIASGIITEITKGKKMLYENIS